MRAHVAAFAQLMTERRGRDLERWITAVTARGLPGLRSFITGLRCDQNAVAAGLTMPWSSGVVEGHVNRKILKRQMYRRASPDLLRRRILLAN